MKGEGASDIQNEQHEKEWGEEKEHFVEKLLTLAVTQQENRKNRDVLGLLCDEDFCKFLTEREEPDRTIEFPKIHKLLDYIRKEFLDYTIELSAGPEEEYKDPSKYEQETYQQILEEILAYNRSNSPQQTIRWAVGSILLSRNGPPVNILEQVTTYMTYRLGKEDPLSENPDWWDYPIRLVRWYLSSRDANTYPEVVRTYIVRTYIENASTVTKPNTEPNMDWFTFAAVKIGLELISREEQSLRTRDPSKPVTITYEMVEQFSARMHEEVFQSPIPTILDETGKQNSSVQSSHLTVHPDPS